jgi:alkanesulfonate monooxygenase
MPFPSPGDPDMRPLEFGWFLPTSGDTESYGRSAQEVPASPEMFERVIAAAEDAGFEYMLVPVQTVCWEAWITSAMMIGRSKSIKLLVAARPGYINPVLLAKMIATFDQMSGGRISINLIAGQSEKENMGEGIPWAKEQRYEIMEEEVTILKTIWAAKGPVDFDGKHYKLSRAQIRPYPLQQPWPKFYLGGGSGQAMELSAKHSDVHLFWGDTYAQITANMTEIRALAVKYGRSEQIGFGMRLQIICRETEEEAWEAANGLVEGVSDKHKQMIKTHFATSVANQRMQELGESDLIEPHLWTGLTKVRPGAGVAVVGNPQQVAGVLQTFIDLGCQSFCLSGYLHDEEARRFGQWVRPILMASNPGRMKALPA